MIKKIGIIGAGQLGSRHLQGIARSSIAISIEVVEPFESARKIAEERYYQIEDRPNVEKIDFYDSIDKLSQKIDLVIIATGADVRFTVLQELVSKKDVLSLVLEKILFQRLEEYGEIEKLLDVTNTKCWVNHPRRMFPAYKKLKAELIEARQVSYNYQGGDWGLACNALHLIDHLAYLTTSSKLTIHNQLLDNKIYDSKRSGFIEFNGLITGSIDNHLFSLYSNAEGASGILSIVSDVLTATIDEAKGEMLIRRKEDNWEPELVKEKIIYFQSELSNIFIEDILRKNTCDLPRYKEAMNLHMPFIKSLLDCMGKITNKEQTLCPIT